MDKQGYRRAPRLKIRLFFPDSLQRIFFFTGNCIEKEFAMEFTVVLKKDKKKDSPMTHYTYTIFYIHFIILYYIFPILQKA